MKAAFRREINKFIKEIWINLGKPYTYNEICGIAYYVLRQKDVTEQAPWKEWLLEAMKPEQLEHTLQLYQEDRKRKEGYFQLQVRRIIEKEIPSNTANRSQVIQDTVNMLKKFPLVTSLHGIRTLVIARVNNQHQDVPYTEYMYSQ